MHNLSGDYAGFPGCGLLRLHSTYRHDLKIYASDEGRVQMTAAAFAKVIFSLRKTPLLGAIWLFLFQKTLDNLNDLDFRVYVLLCLSCTCVSCFAASTVVFLKGMVLV